MYKKIFLVLLLILTLNGCTSSKLEVHNVQITNDILTWDAVTNATSYIVYVDLAQYEVATNELDLTTLNLAVGTYQVSVSSKINNTISAKSEAVTYVVNSVMEFIQFDSPIQYTYLLDGLTYNVKQNDISTYYDISSGLNHYFKMETSDLYYGMNPNDTWFSLDNSSPYYNYYFNQSIHLKWDGFIESEYTLNNDTLVANNASTSLNSLFFLPTTFGGYSATSMSITNTGVIEVSLSNTLDSISLSLQVNSLNEMPSITSNTNEFSLTYEEASLVPNGLPYRLNALVVTNESFGTVYFDGSSYFQISGSNNNQLDQEVSMVVSNQNGIPNILNTISVDASNIVLNTQELLTSISASNFDTYQMVNLTDATLLSHTASTYTLSANGSTYTVVVGTNTDSVQLSQIASINDFEHVNFTYLMIGNDGNLYYTHHSTVELVNDIVNLTFKADSTVKLLKEAATDNDVTTGLPSIGNPKVLVLPVAFANYPAPTDMKQTIETTLFGTPEVTGYQSLQSFYYKSSYGALTIEGTVLNPYTLPNNASYYENRYNLGYDVDYEIMKYIVTYYNSSVDYSQYDTDGDGYMDAVILVYTAPVSFDTGSDLWWAYTYEYYTSAPEYYDGVEMDFYMFIGYDFIYETFNYDTNQTVDYNAITFIHETGHLLGLDDYYDYDTAKGPAGGLGGGDMMDYAVGDHNAYSKLMLGWITPDITNGTSGSFSLSPFESSGDALIIPRNWNGSYFTEFLILDFFTPTGLNSYHLGYNGWFETAGLRIYHVNATMDTYNNIDSIWSVTKYDNSYTTTLLIKLVEADGNWDIPDTSSSVYGGYSEDSDLFRVGQSLHYTWYDKTATPVVTVTSITTDLITFNIVF